MIRVLFSVLAVVVAVLAIVLEKPILYVVAAVLLLIVVVLVVAVLRRRHRGARSLYAAASASTPSDELKSLGIMDIRPKVRPAGGEANGATSASGQEPPAASEAARPKQKVYGASTGDPSGPDVEVREKKEAPPVEKEDASPPAEAAQQAEPGRYEEDVLVPCLRALRSAVGAQTACLLRQEHGEPDYHVVALVDAERAVSDGETFSAPLLAASLQRQPVAVQQVGEEGLSFDSLGYSARPSVVRQVALAAVPSSPDGAACVLLVDADEEELLDRPRTSRLLEQFAQLLGTLLDAGEDRWPARPRRDIIAEEMEQARARNQLLALALVYLNRAEDVAGEGRASLDHAEHLLATRLREAIPQGRVERFGELTYGVFYSGREVEAWGAQVQHAFAAETGPLEGGVSIGIALLQDRHRSPDDFRGDATEALREAFESGTCTILE